jgi:hypothetical protein
MLQWHLSIAEWLYGLGKIDIHEENHGAFPQACSGEDSSLVVAQWLYGLGGIDIHAENDEAFFIACINGE